MTSSPSMDEETGGTCRLLLKYNEAMDSNRFYEAHQLVRTINFRYQNRKVAELEGILTKAAIALLDKFQYESGSDVGIMFIKLCQSKNLPVTVDRIKSLCLILARMKSSPERITFINTTTEWAGIEIEASNDFNHLASRVYIQEKSYGEAWKHLIRMSDPNMMSSTLCEIMSSLNIPQEEFDVTLAILIFTLLGGKRTEVADAACSAFVSSSQINSPLLNGIRFIIESCKRQDVVIFKKVRKIYAPSLSREPNLERLLNAVGKVYFNLSVESASGSRNGFLQSLMSSFAAPFPPTAPSQAPPPQQSRNNNEQLGLD